MAPRRSATKTQARERARRAATEAMAREQRLLQWGEEFFLAQGEEDQILEAAERRVAEIRAKAAQEAARAKQAQARVVAGMKAERVPTVEIAQRLELASGEVRALLKETADPEPSTGTVDPELVDAAEHVVGQAPAGV